MYWSGWRLLPAERVRLLRRIPTVYPDVYADHITHRYGFAEYELPSLALRARIIAIADDNKGVQTLVVTVNDNSIRPDGSTYHITWSIDRSLGRAPVDSNLVVKTHDWQRVSARRIIFLEAFCEPLS